MRDLPRMDSVNVKIALVRSLNWLSSFTIPTEGLTPSGIFMRARLESREVSRSLLINQTEKIALCDLIKMTVI